MFKKIALATVAAATAFTAMPSAAEARHRDGYYESGRYERAYRGDRYDRYENRNYRNYRNDYRGGRRCSGTTGTILGGVVGALLGREVTRDRYRGRSGTTGAIIGGAAGALGGRAIDKGNC
jgi:hypothetical protein